MLVGFDDGKVYLYDEKRNVIYVVQNGVIKKVPDRQLLRILNKISWREDWSVW